MTGLVGYGSSDDEDFIDEDQPTQLESEAKVWPYIRLSPSVTDRIDLRPHRISYRSHEAKERCVSRPASYFLIDADSRSSY